MINVANLSQLQQSNGNKEMNASSKQHDCAGLWAVCHRPGGSPESCARLAYLLLFSLNEPILIHLIFTMHINVHFLKLKK